jgi:tRNA G18 (ribose-2'-O)-methylase SpoU
MRAGHASSKSEKGGKPSGKPTKHRKGPPKSGAPRKARASHESAGKDLRRARRAGIAAHHPKRVKQIWLSEGRSEPRLQTLLALAAENRVPVGQAERREMDAWVEGVHQGVVAEVSPSQVWGERCSTSCSSAPKARR